LGPVAYFLPPYCIEPADLHRAWDTLESALLEDFPLVENAQGMASISKAP
jgi:transposase